MVSQALIVVGGTVSALVSQHEAIGCPPGRPRAIHAGGPYLTNLEPPQCGSRDDDRIIDLK